MRGYPDYLNTKEDYLYVHDNFPRELWLPDFQALLDSYMDWFFEKHLASRDEGIEDETHKIVESETEDDSGEMVTTYDQYELRENPMAKIFRIGFTVAEVKALMEA